MSRATSYDELYSTLGAVVAASTGRSWWRKAGIQAQPVGPFATVYMVEGVGLEHQVVEPIDDGDDFRQVPWNATTQDVVVEFTRSAAGDTALEAATRFRTALYLEARFLYLWEIAGLVGGVRLIDVSSIFRADVEPRAQVRFSIIANIADPPPVESDVVGTIDSQTVNVKHINQGDDELAFDVVVGHVGTAL